jgi:hypothetical protein
MAYGTKFNDHETIEAAAAAARDQAYWPRGGTNPQEPVGFVYRVNAVSYAVSSGWDDDFWSSTGPILEVDAYAVRKWTKCGATLFLTSGSRPKWCNFQSTKQFACRTVEEALESFRQRRLSQIRRLKAQIARAETELEMVELRMGLRPDPIREISKGLFKERA